MQLLERAQSDRGALILVSWHKHRVMERTPVPDSRAIASLGYDEAAQVLEIEYRNGSIYRYLRVPPSVYAWLQRTPHKGAFVARKIANDYAFEQQGPPEPGEGALERALRESLQPREPNAHDDDDAT